MSHKLRRSLILLIFVIIGLLLPNESWKRWERGTVELPQAAESAGDRQTPLWTSTRQLSARENAESHWEKHRDEFPEYQTAEDYINGAHRFFRDPPGGTKEKTRPNGDRLLYHEASNTFGVQAASGAPRTLFRPRSGKRYWERQ